MPHFLIHYPLFCLVFFIIFIFVFSDWLLYLVSLAFFVTFVVSSPFVLSHLVGFCSSSLALFLILFAKLSALLCLVSSSHALNSWCFLSLDGLCSNLTSFSFSTIFLAWCFASYPCLCAIFSSAWLSCLLFLYVLRYYFVSCWLILLLIRYQLICACYLSYFVCCHACISYLASHLIFALLIAPLVWIVPTLALILISYCPIP